MQLVINDVDQACTALVAPDGHWLCTIARGPGSYTVKARQSIPDRGTSSASPSITVEIKAAPVTPEAPEAPPPPKPAPVIPPPPAAPEKPQPTPSPSPTTEHREDALNQPWLDRPIFPGASGEGTTIREALTNWGSPTTFGTQLPTLRDTVTQGNWVWAPALALLFVLLFALPLRLLARMLHGRFKRPRMDFLGRNGSARAAPAEEPTPATPGSWGYYRWPRPPE